MSHFLDKRHLGQSRIFALLHSLIPQRIQTTSDINSVSISWSAFSFTYLSPANLTYQGAVFIAFNLAHDVPTVVDIGVLRLFLIIHITS